MNEQDTQQPAAEELHQPLPVSGMYENYFLEYASYVILERAVPLLDDGLKPVQRRILHALREMEDGRFHKVANAIGQTMQYHPHGDAAIGDALVGLGQKDLMLDTQGNWGDVRTGDSAAAPRYIETRLSKFALEVAFNAKITEWQLSYDGRKREPVALPMKFPLVLAQGVEGIAVGLSTKILPHNFIELCKASIDVLKGKKTQLIPDFPTGGLLDASEYRGGGRGGRVRCRAKIEVIDKSSLLITQIPFGTTTESLMESIVKANEKEKIKIKSIVDNTAAEVAIEIKLPPGISPDVTIDALYAFTDCEVSLSPNACVISGDRPYFLTVDEILERSTHNTVDLLRQELEVQLSELREKFLFSSLEKIFIENRIYRDIEECETFEEVIKTTDRGLEPYKQQFYREIVEDDLLRLLEIRIKRISKYDSFKADELMRQTQEEIAEKEHHLAHLTEFAINFFKHLMDKYGKGRERKTEIRAFDTIEVRQVAVANEKLYVNRKEGFIGTGLKKDEFVKDCSDLDDIIVFRKDGKYIITRIGDKKFVGKDIIHIDVWQKDDERMIYHAVYRDPKSGKNFVKRFAVTAITRDREYDLTNGEAGAAVVYFSANPNSESEIVKVYLTRDCRAKIKEFEFNFGEIAIKGRSSQGNILTTYPIRKVEHKSYGASTMGGRKMWFDDITGKLNTDERGRYLGEFDTEDKLLVIFNNGTYEIQELELTTRYEMKNIAVLEKFSSETVVSVVHYDGKNKDYYVKRFQIETTTIGKPFVFISEEAGSKLAFVSTDPEPSIAYKADKKTEAVANLAEIVDIKGWKALGNRLDKREVSQIKGIATQPKPAAESLPTSDEPIEEQPKKDSVPVGSKIEWSGDGTLFA